MRDRQSQEHTWVTDVEEFDDGGLVTSPYVGNTFLFSLNPFYLHILSLNFIIAGMDLYIQGLTFSLMRTWKISQLLLALSKQSVIFNCRVAETFRQSSCQIAFST